MKKSTLITTIAMIVVVVVALSTATYAWFSSSSRTYATQTISTQGTSDIAVTTNTEVLQTTDKVGVFGGTNLLEHTIYAATLTDSERGLRYGLWAPQGIIASKENSSNSSTSPAVDNLTSFIGGTIGTNGMTFTATSAITPMSPDIVRVTANVAKANIYMNVYVCAKTAHATAAKDAYAAQGVSFYLADTTSTVVAQTTYSYLKASMTASTDFTKADGNSAETVEPNDTMVESSVFTPGNPETAYDASSFANGKKGITDSASANHRATSTAAGTNFIATSDAKVVADITNFGLTSYAECYVMTVDLGAFTAGQAKNFILYTWLDGHYLDDAAGLADVAIAYSFSDTNIASTILGS